MLLLDTNVVSELRKVAAGKADPSVVVWNETVDPAETFISSVVLHELEIGVRLVEHNDAVAGKVLRNWLENTVLTAFSGRILPLDEAAAVKAAQWHVPNPKPINDAYIAATAFTRRMTLVTRNIKDFEGMGVALVNPWDTPA
ncbi:type II toxin-antitoxin system VapC family toxin [Neorhizobium galegae]|uniref:type II toxin-antitoxin system VapC family toxin n=1 Tax=Neorhizobium galegae TaxID=399 RepID=UPI000622825E|nr:type II toxin-antitoxin system VapC family toxin [Neorhizobium galegae]CDZ64322.1 Probable ribonuclease VapC [Neorhizobium galegae bv. orientalis]KAB1122032.1 type II toxin-antitoxin system VapC family toxin [Neorhizobium galegae]MCQ1574247.1 type II toxin-antitoxin system VapC family toxin [Neorhizobium galegae]MCQ1810731.1 type II toxin-antitoxin system VapC family toxin [Neorhizobium galegae]MCQ1837627.1 type II toxin-antitoxin system VapC family toxin [Neorhizobium galegae]